LASVFATPVPPATATFGKIRTSVPSFMATMLSDGSVPMLALRKAFTAT
jgi:hypothetical protein